MALCVAATIATGEEPTADVFARRFLSDLERGSGPIAEMFWTGGPGIATMRALSRLQAGAEAATCGSPDDGGNGAAMRAHPVGFLRDRDDVLRVAAVQARVTHGHPAAVASAQAVAVLCFDAIAGATSSATLPSGIDEPTFARAWELAHRDAGRGGELPSHLRDVDMSGWATVAGAHAIALRYDDAMECIGRAAASGRDSDTVAAIVGAIVGARFGRGALDDRLVAAIDARCSVLLPP